MATAPTQITLDLSNYKDRSGARVEPGDYPVIIDSYEVGKARTGNVMLTIWFRITEGEEKDSMLVDRYTITEKALFRMVGLMNAVGLKTPNKRFRFNPSVLTGKRLIVTVTDGEEYMGRITSSVVGWMKAKSNGPKASDPWETVPEDEDEETTEEAPEVEDEDEEPEPPKPKAKKKSKPAPEPEEDEEDEEDEEEEPPAPPKKTSKRKFKAKPAPVEDDEDEDEDDDEVDIEEVNLR